MPSFYSLTARIAAFVLAAGALLSACQVDVQQPRPVPPPDSGGGYCTREYAPVCARRGSRFETFNNSCLAEDEGYRIVSAGECRGGGGGGGGGGGVAVDLACPKNLDPVCASRGSDQRTFANECRAEEAGFRVNYPGECGVGGGGVGTSEQFCTREYAPVCARRGSRLKTFSNQCEAENARFQVVSDGPC